MRRRRAITATALVTALAAASGCSLVADRDPVPSDTHTAEPTPSPESSVPAETPEAAEAVAPAARQQLATLQVKGRAPMSGYDRSRFGQPWLDADRNGCDTRNDVLREHLVGVVLQPGTHSCVVIAGTLDDPYTGTRIDFVQGDGTLVDVDHVVALGNAWVTGAFQWDIKKRAALANDPMNLLAVDASANRQKGDGDAATWLPSKKSSRCEYVARQVGVKAKYGLWATPAEHAAIERVLAGCPDQPSAVDSGAPTRVDHDITDPAAHVPPPGNGGTVHHENCDAARAVGAAPVRRGDPGYGPHLDGDGDGVACE